MQELSIIKGYHAHIYFDDTSVHQAERLCRAAGERFGVGIGRMHNKNVGPHPRWSCQLSASPAQFASLLPWLALNRDGLVIFAHPDTGQHLADHRDRAIWLGVGLELDLSIFDGLV